MDNIYEVIRKKKVALAAHRGTCGGNIPFNSIAAFKAAVCAGADVVELDVEKSRDGVLFVEHPGFERIRLRLNDTLRNYSADFIRELRLTNWDNTWTEYKIITLEEALLYLCDKCIVNIDKFDGNPEEIAALVRKLGVGERVLLKTPYKKEFLDDAEKYASDLPFMVYAWDVKDAHEDLMSRNLRYAGLEVLFKDESSAAADEAFINKLKKDGKFVWANANVYDYKQVTAAGHNDDVSLLGNPEQGWGWLADKGYDIIQTDFIYQSRRYLEDTGRRF